MKRQTKANQTLEDLEKCVWPDAGEATQMVRECHRLRKLPICDLSDAQLGLLIRQGIGGRHLIEEAIARLEANPILSASMAAGDLLWSVLQADDRQFRSWPDTHRRLKTIAKAAELAIERLPESEQVHYLLRSEIHKYGGQID